MEQPQTRWFNVNLVKMFREYYKTSKIFAHVLYNLNLCNEACLSYKSLSEANSIFRIYDFQCKEVSKDPVQYRKILCTISKNRAKVCK